MTTIIPSQPKSTGPAYEPEFAYTAQQIEDIRRDEFRAGYRLGVVHGREQATAEGVTR